jgi:hypothetical protein
VQVLDGNGGTGKLPGGSFMVDKSVTQRTEKVKLKVLDFIQRGVLDAQFVKDVVNRIHGTLLIKS